MYHNQMKEIRLRRGITLEELSRKNRNIYRVFKPSGKGVKKQSIYKNYGQNSICFR